MSHPLKHFKIIMKHRHGVIKNGFHLGIFFHTLRHDLSKFSFYEFSRSSKYFLGNRSPTNKEREAHDGFSDIAVHHTHRNKHHFEYWCDFYRGYIIVKPMPYVYALEFAADMMSASKTYNKKQFSREEVLEYFLTREMYFTMHSGTKQFIKEVLQRYVRSEFKELHKKETKKLYQEILKDLPKTEFYRIDPIPLTHPLEDPHEKHIK